MFSNLLNELLIIIDDQRNRQNLELWDPLKSMLRSLHGNAPRPLEEINNKIPFTAEILLSFWARMFKFSMSQCFKDPNVYLEAYLKSTIYKYYELRDNIPVRHSIPFWVEGALEPSLFGIKPIFTPNNVQWTERDPILKDPADLDLLKIPDFYKDGLMPQIHSMYKELKRIVGKDFDIVFPHWERGPFGTAFTLRGTENLLMDLYDKPGFVQRLMRLLTDTRKKWVQQRAEFLGEPISKAVLADDDVNSPTISPKIFEKYIMPYEKEISEYQGGIAYWHSCGNITDFIDLITRIGPIDMQHVSQCSDLKVIAETCPGVPLEICLNPIDDVLIATKEKMKQKIEKTIEICKEANVKAFTISTGALSPFRSEKEDLSQLKLWISVAENICNR